MTSNDIMVIDDNETLDLTMTLIIGIRTKAGLILASDGLAGYSITGLEHLPREIITNAEKIHVVAPKVVYGVSGASINWNERLKNDISNLLSDNPTVPLASIAKVIAEYLPNLYKENMSNPDFFLVMFFAGFSPDDDTPVMYQIHGGEVRSWEDDHPWMTVGTENNRSDVYIKKHFKGTRFTRGEAIKIAKGAISDTSHHNPEAVGGHTFVYELTKKGVVRLE